MYRFKTRGLCISIDIALSIHIKIYIHLYSEMEFPNFLSTFFGKLNPQGDTLVTYDTDF